MALTVNSNIQALNAYRNLNKTQAGLSSSLEKLSSGLRINRAADDAAGLAISEGLKAQIGGIQQASKNAQDGVSLVQTADGALSQSQAILQRLRTLAVQSANGSQSTDSRTAINAEASALKSELTRISDTSSFNSVNLLDGTYKAGRDFQVGYKADGGSVTGNTIRVSVDSQGATVNAASAADARYTGTAATGYNRDYGTTSVNFDVVQNGVTLSFTYGTSLAASTSDEAGTTLAAAFTALNSGKLQFSYSAATDMFTVTSSSALNGPSDTLTFAANAILGFGATTVAGASAIEAVTAGSFSAGGLGVASLDLSTQTTAVNAITAIDTAIKNVSTARASLGALQNRFQYTVDNLDTTAENLSAAQSRITDTDMASEMVNFTRAQILSQAGTSMLSQAKNLPSSILSLLQG